MPVRSWSMRLDGDSFDASMFVDSHGRVVVSTTASTETAEAGPLTRITRMTVGSAPTFVNVHAHRVYAIERDGRVAWSLDKARVLGEAPDGTYVATDDRASYLVLGQNGRELQRRAAARPDWKLLGWEGNEPVVTTSAGCWAAPYVYSVSGHALRRYSRGGELLRATPIPRDLFDAQSSKRPGLAGLPEALLFPSSFELMYQPDLERFIGWCWGPFAWIMSVHPDGFVEWVQLLAESCCNTACFAGTTTVHASSCGRQLTFLSPDGAVIQSHAIDQLSRAVAFDHRAYAIATDALHAFDARGERQWSLDVPHLRLAAARDGAVYTLSGPRDAAHLTAFAV